MDLPGTEYGPWEAVGIAVRTQFRAGDDTRPGFIVCDLSASPLSRRSEIARMIAATPAMVEALKAAQRLVEEALPKFDWGRSNLDANAIQLLNEAPIAIRAALALAQSEPPNNPDPPLEAAGSDQAREAA